MQYKVIPLIEDDDQVYLEAYICEKTQSFTQKAILVIPGCTLGNNITSNGNFNYVNSAIAKWVDHAAHWAECLTE